MTFLSLLQASEYYAKAEPYRTYLLQANVHGLIVQADEEKEGRLLGKRDFLRIDDELDQKELKLLRQKKQNLQVSLDLNRRMAQNLRRMIEKKSENYERIKDLPIKSSVEKDKEFFDLASTQNQELATLEKIETIGSQLNDTQLRLEQLARSISDKRLNAEGMILYKLYVKKGQVVNAGMNLAEVADISRAKLIIYLSAAALEEVKGKNIYLNDVKTDYAIDKIWPLSDAEHISSYRTEIVINAPERFSSLYKIEFKDK